jgi:hypothetical protein
MEHREVVLVRGDLREELRGDLFDETGFGTRVRSRP